MRKLQPITLKIVGALLLIIVVIVFLFFFEYELPQPDGWPDNVKLYRRPLIGITRVVDSNTGRPIFYYLPEYDSPIYPIKVEKIDAEHWQVTFKEKK